MKFIVTLQRYCASKICGTFGIYSSCNKYSLCTKSLFNIWHSFVSMFCIRNLRNCCTLDVNSVYLNRIIPTYRRFGLFTHAMITADLYNDRNFVFKSNNIHSSPIYKCTTLFRVQRRDMFTTRFGRRHKWYNRVLIKKLGEMVVLWIRFHF